MTYILEVNNYVCGQSHILWVTGSGFVMSIYSWMHITNLILFTFTNLWGPMKSSIWQSMGYQFIIIICMHTILQFQLHFHILTSSRFIALLISLCCQSWIPRDHFTHSWPRWKKNLATWNWIFSTPMIWKTLDSG